MITGVAAIAEAVVGEMDCLVDYFEDPVTRVHGGVVIADASGGNRLAAESSPYESKSRTEPRPAS